MTEQQQIEDYLTALRHHLGPMTVGDREEIVREIHAHIRDAAEQPGISMAQILAGLGPAEKLAAQYRDGLLIRQASRSFSPVTLLRGAFRFTRRGMFGIFVAFAGLFGYWLGGGLVLFGVAGSLWMLTQRHTAAAAAYGPPPPFWVLALGTILVVAVGCAILLLTTLLMRTALRVFRRWQSPV